VYYTNDIIYLVGFPGMYLVGSGSGNIVDMVIIVLLYIDCVLREYSPTMLIDWWQFRGSDPETSTTLSIYVLAAYFVDLMNG